MQVDLAPILLFTYNRPEHTRRTLEALADNALAKSSMLYVYSDGAKEGASQVDLQAIKEVRHLIKSRLFCKEVHLVERDNNRGLADNIVDGVTTVVNRYGKVIVLEDDVVTATGFLQYMNEALVLYADEERVMHVSGYWFPVRRTQKLPPTFFYNTATCWGWATWKEAWDKLELNPSLLKSKIQEKDPHFHKFTIEGTGDFLEQLDMNIEGTIKTWAVKWYATIFLNDGYCLHPNPSLTNNIGHDGSGENSGAFDRFRWKQLPDQVEVKKIPIVESKAARKYMRKFNKNWYLFVLSNLYNLSTVLLSPQSRKYLKKTYLQIVNRK